jgi:hypothetical protein
LAVTRPLGFDHASSRLAGRDTTVSLRLSDFAAWLSWSPTGLARPKTVDRQDLACKNFAAAHDQQADKENRAAA